MKIAQKALPTLHPLRGKTETSGTGQQEAVESITFERDNLNLGDNKEPIDPVAAGSAEPTSDVDVTYVSLIPGNQKVETEAVIEFNRLFREEFGVESGTAFDLNVYTTGHMPSSAMGAPLNEILALRKLSKYLNAKRTLKQKQDQL